MLMRDIKGLNLSRCALVSLLSCSAVLSINLKAGAQGVQIATGQSSTQGHTARLQPLQSPESQRLAPWTQTGRYSTNQYFGTPILPGCANQGIPGGSITYIQPDGAGGYIYGDYGSGGQPSIYGIYSDAPGYVVVNNGSVQDILPVSGNPNYYSPYAPPTTPAYQVNEYSYTVNNYYSGQAPATSAQPELASSSGAQAYDQVFSDIQEAWLTGSFDLLKKHLPGPGLNLSVSIGGQQTYTVESDRFLEVTQDTFGKLTTYGFVLTSVHKNNDGTMTGSFTHTYAPANDSSGDRHTMYLKFTLANLNGAWQISSIDTALSSEPAPQTTQVISGKASS